MFNVSNRLPLKNHIVFKQVMLQKYIGAHCTTTNIDLKRLQVSPLSSEVAVKHDLLTIQ